MQVVVNGETQETPDICTVADLLSQLAIGRDRVAVEINLQIVPKSRYDGHVLQQDDKIEIVHFVGGG